MLAVEFKKTDKIDFVKPLKKYITNEYSKEMWSSLEKGVEHLQQMREDIRLTCEKSEATLEKVLAYRGLLLSVEKRLPINEATIRICFYWYDSATKKRAYNYSIHFELANVLFNIGAFYSHLANCVDLNNDEMIKKAGQNFQLSAGTFQKLSEILATLPQIQAQATTDFSSAYLDMLQKLMLAQAQECFYIKALQAKMKNNILAKLALAAAELYDESISSTESVVKQSLYANCVPANSAIMKAKAFYHQSEFLGENSEYGVQLGFIRKAFEAINIDQKFIKISPSYTQEVYAKTRTTIESALKQAEYNNGKIYHELVPKTLPKFDATRMAKGVVPNDTVPVGDADPFKGLVPFAVSQAVSEYALKKDGILREYSERMQEDNEVAQTSLTSMALPGAIQAVEIPSGIPSDVHEKIRQFKAKGGVRRIHELTSTLTQLSEEDVKLLDSALNALDEEEEENNRMQDLFGTRWSRTPSHALTAQIREEAAKYRGNIEHAKKSDLFVQKKFKENEEMLKKLSGNEADIISLLPKTEAPSSATLGYVHQLKSLIQDLNSVIETRSKIIQELRDFVSKDDIVSVFMASHLPKEQVFAEQLKKYEPLKERYERNKKEQEKLIAAICQANENFVKSRGNNDLQRGREVALQNISSAFNSFKELEGYLIEGIEFYTNFAELLRKYKSKCLDFCYARQTEKEENVASLNSQLTQAKRIAEEDANKARAEESLHQQFQGLSFNNSGSVPQFYIQPNVQGHNNVIPQPYAQPYAAQPYVPMMISPNQIPPGFVPVQTPQGTIVMMPAQYQMPPTGK